MAAEVVDPPAGVVDFALVGRVERAQKVQQRALAGTALADDRQKLAATDAQAHAPQDRHFDRALAVALVQVDGEELVVVDDVRFRARIGWTVVRGCVGSLTPTSSATRAEPEFTGTDRSTSVPSS